MPSKKDQNNTAEMSFVDHLEELRKRIIVCLIAVTVSVLISLSFSKPIERVLRLPLDLSTNKLISIFIDRTIGSDGNFAGFLSITLRSSSSTVNAQLIKDGPVEGIMAYLKIGFTFGILAVSPIILYQAWAFVLPALTTSEKRFALPLFMIIVFFFLIGGLFAYFVVVPVVLDFSSKLFGDINNLWGIERYFNFLIQLIIGFGIAFELPIVMTFLSWIGVIDSNGFRDKRRIAIVVIMVISALLTPADVLSMLLMAIPLTILYELGIFFAFLVQQETENYA